jgi:pantoate--beta-alanine ligase
LATVCAGLHVARLLSLLFILGRDHLLTRWPCDCYPTVAGLIAFGVADWAQLNKSGGVKILTTIAEMHARPPRKPCVLVPTMGALHKAHGELIRVARQAAGNDGEVAVSIFVNPLQFEPGSDYERYPRPEKADEEFCRGAGVDLLFRPPVDEIYLGDRSTFVEETTLSRMLEGKSRPGHFRGVCTVVTKLFNIVAPEAAVFGEKDFQQLAIIRRMVRDLNFNIEIIAVPTVREVDGLACSSRNQYLNADERKQAPVLRKALLAAANTGKKSAGGIIDLVKKTIGEATLARIDYVELVDAESLQPIEVARPNSLVAVAVFFGKTRLIDNIRLA